jgi:hypothetical protein
LTVTTEPSWRLSKPIAPRASRIVLEQTGDRQPIANWIYPQKARLDWVDDGIHYSQTMDWAMQTDAAGNWPSGDQNFATPSWRQAASLWALAGLFAVVGIAVAIRGRDKARFHPTNSTRLEELSGAGALTLAVIWTIFHAAPHLWLLETWSTGGDVASHVFYAKVFMEWLPQGKFSGWLPESFAGFPAFTFYFPFPFTIAGIMQFAVGQQVAFKLASMSPAFLLPIGTYLLGWSWGWRVPQRLLASAGAIGFIAGDSTSIWGGNVLAQLAGEFAYSWGMLLTTLFWAALSISLKRGGRWWLLAVVLEALVALSHGYALLIAGFGAFAYVLVSKDHLRSLRLILQVHLLAFLLIGFWLIPLVENLPWTIPNDTSTAIDNWKTLWPPSLWPLAIGSIPLLWLLSRKPAELPPGIAFLVSICMLSLFGFVFAERLGLADLRFYPFAQWALAVACGGALGWALLRIAPSVAVLLAMAVLVALGGWWEPRLDRMEEWSEWNLSGYERKPMWPHYRATAQANQGGLTDARLVFEHAPANNDLGSTRALEALPMFGTRPALEGLYMESAITGPFIYQLQAEISERPSSPLSRYPSSERSLEQAIGHLNELYVNRIILRSPEKKALFADDDRFRLVAEHGPLQTYELKKLETRLVDIVTAPLVAESRDAWLNDAFRRFVSEFPYRERRVYLADGQPAPTRDTTREPAEIEIIHFSREGLTFKTDRPGEPHLVRMSYHPRWRSEGGEEVYLAEPAFMVLFPNDRTVTLNYAWARGDWVGFAFTLSGFAFFFWAFWLHSPLNVTVMTRDPPRVSRAFSAFLLIAAGLVLIGWWIDPERIYKRGHLNFERGDRVNAAQLFESAYQGRGNPAGRAEALFWAARSWQLAGNLEAASHDYQRLITAYRENYWYPESVFRLIEIHLEHREKEAALGLYRKLAEDMPGNKWTGEAARLLDAKTGPQPNE